METLEALVIEENDKHFIEIATGGEDIRIPISEDKPNEVKSAFNKLIERIKEGEFEIEFEGKGDDLFNQVAKEYITQLNREIAEVRDEMTLYGLIEDWDGEGDDIL
ncbi:hypothetical protein ACWPKO_07000 [Coraliomargarita sp. W4R53]